MHHYTEEQAEKLKAIYPVGSSVEVFLSTPHKGREFEVQSSGKIIEVDRAGVHAEVYEAETNKEFVQILRPNHDRFVIKTPEGVGPALTTQK